MKEPLLKRLTFVDFGMIGIGSLLFLYLYAGFFFPDSYLMSYGKNPTRILWFIRIVLPLILGGLVALYVNVRLGRIGAGHIVVLSIVTFFSVIIVYLVADAYYQHWFDKHRQQYHPFLQLMPPDDKPLDKDTTGELTIYFVGGSTTELTDSKGRDWPSRVDSILRTHYGMRSVKVHNLGRQWYTSLHTLINYETNLRKHHPSLIVYMESINDVLQNADFSYFSHGPFRDDYGHFYGPVNRIIDRRTLFRYVLDVVRGFWYATPRKVLTIDNFPGLSVYERNVETIIQLATHDTTKVILMTEPYLIKKEMTQEELSAIGMIKVEAINDTMVWSSETIRSGMEQYNNALAGLARKNNLLLIDLEKQVPKSLQYFTDEVHYRDTTFSLIAPFVAEKLYRYVNSMRPN
ncbi:MAG TPA: SGNH/GDSL hydrolase family protein [Bacteroidota bacterium]|nr:SGNH/GDSL hydrolase family protein [Bacteroidota bacterium]